MGAGGDPAFPGEGILGSATSSLCGKTAEEIGEFETPQKHDAVSNVKARQPVRSWSDMAGSDEEDCGHEKLPACDPCPLAPANTIKEIGVSLMPPIHEGASVENVSVPGRSLDDEAEGGQRVSEPVKLLVNDSCLLMPHTRILPCAAKPKHFELQQGYAKHNTKAECLLGLRLAVASCRKRLHCMGCHGKIIGVYWSCEMALFMDA